MKAVEQAGRRGVDVVGRRGVERWDRYWGGMVAWWVAEGVEGFEGEMRGLRVFGRR